MFEGDVESLARLGHEKEEKKYGIMKLSVNPFLGFYTRAFFLSSKTLIS
jgi:hypothetical protein